MKEDIDIDVVMLDDVSTLIPREEIQCYELEHPCDGAYFLMNHVVFEEELNYFITNTGLPVFCMVADQLKEIGKMEPTISNISKAKFLETGISFISSSREKLTFDCPDDLYRFVSIKPSIGANWNLFLEELQIV